MTNEKEVADKYFFYVLREDTDDKSRQQAYSEWSSRYDKDLVAFNYKGPGCAAKTVASFYPNLTEKILDIGAGTGLVAEELLKFGSCNIDALEPNLEMLEIAKSKNLYQHYYNEYIPEEGQTSIPDRTYDVITCSGSFGSGHLPCNVLSEMTRITKPDGLVVITTNPIHFTKVDAYKDKLLTMMEQIESEGKWAKLQEETIPNYVRDMDGVLLVYRVH